jgi:hypothetical protein
MRRVIASALNALNAGQPEIPVAMGILPLEFAAGYTVI